MMQLIRLSLFLCLVGGLVIIAHTSVFSQFNPYSSFWASPQLTAPTAMSLYDYSRVTTHIRQQSFIEGTGYRSMLISGQLPLLYNKRTKVGTLGINLMRDESGASYLFTTTGVMLSYNYEVNISRQHHLVGGLQGGYAGRKLNWNRVTTSSQFADGGFNPGLNHGEHFDNNQSSAFSANAGVAYYFSDRAGEQVFHIGAGFMNINKGHFTYLHNDQDQAVPSRFVMYSQLRLVSQAEFELISNGYWLRDPGMSDLVGGLQLRKGLDLRERVSDKHLAIGLYYSQDHTGILALQLMQSNWLMAVSYDMPFGRDVRRLQSGAEVTLGWRAMQTVKRTFYGPVGSKRKTTFSKGKKKWKPQNKKRVKAFKPKRNKPFRLFRKTNKKLPWNASGTSVPESGEYALVTVGDKFFLKNQPYLL